MTNEEAKQIYVRAVENFEKKEYLKSLDLLDALDNERPNSRQVTYHRARCLIALNRTAEASECIQRLDGKLEKERVEELRHALDSARTAHTSNTGVSAPAAAPAPAAANGNAPSVFVIESVFTASVNESTVVGHVQSGVFHTGDNLTLVSPDGMPFIAPILRLGPAETPVNLVRAGQKTLMLLKVDPNLVSPGTTATTEAQAEYYAATMVVSSEPQAPSSTSVTSEMVEAEKLLKQGKYEEARGVLEARLKQEPGNRSVYRMLARIFLEAAPPLQDKKLALEHIRRAYELGGAEDPAVIHTLAQALAGNGEADQGLRFLERLHAGNLPLEARMALSRRILEFRDQHGLGHLWEFADAYGEVVFEAKSMGELVKALRNGTVSRDAKCRKDHIGEWGTIQGMLAPDHPEIAALFKPSSGVGFNPWILVAIVVLAAAIVAAVLLL